MKLIVTLVGADADMRASAALARKALADGGASPGLTDWLDPDRACDIAVEPASDDGDGLRIESIVRAALNEGLTKQAFERLKSVIGVASDELCRVAGISSRTVARRFRRSIKALP